MDNGKCSRCLRRADCTLRELAAATLPWVDEARRLHRSDWERLHAVRRALRGCGPCPGFAEDWQVAGAMEDEDVVDLADEILESEDLDLGLLCSRCRHYVGPSAASLDDEPHALAF